jgi:hypothetical protein
MALQLREKVNGAVIVRVAIDAKPRPIVAAARIDAEAMGQDGVACTGLTAYQRRADCTLNRRRPGDEGARAPSSLFGRTSILPAGAGHLDGSLLPDAVLARLRHHEDRDQEHDGRHHA